MSGVSIRKMKEKLCNFLFREHVSALPSATAAALLPRSDLGDEVAVVIADRSGFLGDDLGGHVSGTWNQHDF